MDIVLDALVLFGGVSLLLCYGAFAGAAIGFLQRTKPEYSGALSMASLAAISLAFAAWCFQ